METIHLAISPLLENHLRVIYHYFLLRHAMNTCGYEINKDLNPEPNTQAQKDSFSQKLKKDDNVTLK